MKKIKAGLLSILMCFAVSAAVHAQEVISDYFYPEGRSAYYIYNDEKSGAVEKVNINFERSGNGGRLERESPIPLIGSIKYLTYNGTYYYMLDITDYSVTAKTWWSKDQTSSQNSQSNVRSNLELLKLPAKGEVLNWTTTVNENGAVKQIWEMSAKLTMMAVYENRERVAVHALEVKRNVFDARHNPLPGQSVTEYWQKGKGKVKEIRNK